MPISFLLLHMLPPNESRRRTPSPRIVRASTQQPALPHIPIGTFASDEAGRFTFHHRMHIGVYVL